MSGLLPASPCSPCLCYGFLTLRSHGHSARCFPPVLLRKSYHQHSPPITLQHLVCLYCWCAKSLLPNENRAPNKHEKNACTFRGEQVSKMMRRFNAPALQLVGCVPSLKMSAAWAHRTSQPGRDAPPTRAATSSYSCAHHLSCVCTDRSSSLPCPGTRPRFRPASQRQGERGARSCNVRLLRAARGVSCL